MSDRPRLHYLDNLRAFVIVLVIVLHAAITYMADPPSWWYVIDPDRSVAFTWLVLLVDVPIMQVLFFVAGYFAVRSLQRRGPRGFIREKVVRLAIPWVLGVVFLAPLATYMTYVSRGVPTGYLQFWTVDFWGPMFQQSVYWFLGVLFVAFLVLVYAYLYPARAMLRARGAARRAAAHEPLRPLRGADRGRRAPRLADPWPRRLALALVPLRRPAGADRVLRGLFRPGHLRGAPRLVHRVGLPAQAGDLGRGLRGGRVRLPGIPDGCTRRSACPLRPSSQPCSARSASPRSSPASPSSGPGSTAPGWPGGRSPRTPSASTTSTR